MTYAIKAEIRDERPTTLEFSAQKTMYGGKNVRTGDAISVFASENERRRGLVARGVVQSVRSLGRSDLKPFSDWKDCRPQAELNFKFYRQATKTIVGIIDEAAVFLENTFYGAALKAAMSPTSMRWVVR